MRGNEMEINTKLLKPGMVLIEDVNGKNGKPIVPRDTVLTELHIEFIQKFLIETVNIKRTTTTVSSENNAAKINQRENNRPAEIVFTEVEKEEMVIDPFTRVFREVVTQYKTLYNSWKANVPVNMYHVRQLCMPLFELVETKSIEEIRSLIAVREKDLFYFKSVAVSLLAIKLTQKLNYEKKNWLQVGFAAILMDIGLTKSKLAIDSHVADAKHPLLSFEMIKDEPTLTKDAKLAIIQHHERLDGSGFPLKLTAEKIHPYSRIIAISDRYLTYYLEHGKEAKKILLKQLHQFDEKIVNLL